MIRKKITRIVMIINHIFQVCIMLALGYLQSLTNTRALVMRHLYQRNLEFENHLLSELGLKIQSIIIIILMISSALYLKKMIKKEESYFRRAEVIVFFVLSIIMFSIINFNFFKELLVYGYLIIGFYFILFIQSINLKIVIKRLE